jgi:hypothetical protein
VQLIAVQAMHGDFATKKERKVLTIRDSFDTIAHADGAQAPV